MFLKIYTISAIIAILSTTINSFVVREFFEHKDTNKIDRGCITIFIVASLIPGVQQVNIILEIFIFIMGITEKKAKKIEKEKQKYELLKEDIKNGSGRIYCYRDINRYIEQKLKDISKLYETILQNDLYKISSYDRIKYLLTFIDECNSNKVLSDDDILQEIKSMTDSLFNLLQGYVDNINDINDKATKQVKEYLKKKTDEFVKNNDAITKDFRKVNNI